MRKPKMPQLLKAEVKLPRLKKPVLKKAEPKTGEPRKPRLKRPQLKGPQIKAPQVKAPQFVSDFYRDLRDRRLLLPILALAVALIAVPVLLSSSSEPAPTAPAAPVATDEAAAVQSAVLAEETGIRNYRKRLEALGEKNPFEQKFALPEPGAGGADATASETSSTTDTTSTTSSTGGSTTTSTDASVSSETTGGSSTSVDQTTVDETTVNDGGSRSAPTKPAIRFYAGRVDVTVGPLGKAKTVKNVRYLDFLPNDKAPVVALIGLAEGARKAVFSVSRDVAETDGEGSCAPKKPSPCQFLTLRIGEQRMFQYADGKTYRLKLLDTHVVRIPDPRSD